MQKYVVTFLTKNTFSTLLGQFATLVVAKQACKKIPLTIKWLKISPTKWLGKNPNGDLYFIEYK